MSSEPGRSRVADSSTTSTSIPAPRWPRVPGQGLPAGSGHRPFHAQTAELVRPRGGPVNKGAHADDLAGGRCSKPNLDEGLAQLGSAAFRRLVQPEATQQHLIRGGERFG
jgi:hypothetical protein